MTVIEKMVEIQVNPPRRPELPEISKRRRILKREKIKTDSIRAKSIVEKINTL